MIDLAAFIRACCVPYDEGKFNCFDTALAAFPRSEAVARIAEYWRDVPEDTRRRLTDGTLQFDLERMAARFGLQEADAPTGREIGFVKQLECAPPIFVVGAPGAWFARGKRRAVKLPANVRVSKAWSVA